MCYVFEKTECAIRRVDELECCFSASHGVCSKTHGDVLLALTTFLLPSINDELDLFRTPLHYGVLFLFSAYYILIPYTKTMEEQPSHYTLLVPGATPRTQALSLRHYKCILSAHKSNTLELCIRARIDRNGSDQSRQESAKLP